MLFHQFYVDFAVYTLKRVMFFVEKSMPTSHKTIHLQSLTTKYDCFTCVSSYTTTYDFA